MRHCRNITLLTAAFLTAALLSPAAADDGALATAPAVASDTDAATSPGATPAAGPIAAETTPAEVAGPGYAKSRIRHAARHRMHAVATYRPATRVAWIEPARPFRSIIFLGIGF
jgi:hypothetical protein